MMFTTLDELNEDSDGTPAQLRSGCDWTIIWSWRTTNEAAEHLVMQMENTEYLAPHRHLVSEAGWQARLYQRTPSRALSG